MAQVRSCLYLNPPQRLLGAHAPDDGTDPRLLLLRAPRAIFDRQLSELIAQRTQRIDERRLRNADLALGDPRMIHHVDRRGARPIGHDTRSRANRCGEFGPRMSRGESTNYGVEQEIAASLECRVTDVDISPDQGGKALGGASQRQCWNVEVKLVLGATPRNRELDRVRDLPSEQQRDTDQSCLPPRIHRYIDRTASSNDPVCCYVGNHKMWFDLQQITFIARQARVME